MRGLRTQESLRFHNFFRLVQDAAAACGAVFFLNSGEGRDITTESLDGEDLFGWLIPTSRAGDFEKVWRDPMQKVPDEWGEFLCFAEWEQTDNGLAINFRAY